MLASISHVQHCCGTHRFADLESATQKALAEIGTSVTFASGQLLFEQGSPHTCTYFIEQGLVRTFYTSYSGREVTLCVWADGDLAGGPNFFGNGVHVWSGVASRQTRALAVRGDELKALARRMPNLALWIADVAMFKLKWVSLLFQVNGTESVAQRLPHLLLMLGELYGRADGKHTVIKHRLNQSDLSTLLGISRQWTNKAMGELKDLGLVKLERDHIIIVDHTGLARRAQGL